MNKINKKKVRKLEKELRILCDEMIANIKKKKGNISIEEVRKSSNMWCELATL